MAADGDVAWFGVDRGVEVIEGRGIEQVMHEDGSDVVGLFDGHVADGDCDAAVLDGPRVGVLTG